MNLGLSDKVVIVSGSSKGIGKGIADILANEGAYVFLTGRDAIVLNKSREDLSLKYPGKIYSVDGDLNDDNVLKKIRQDAINRFGQIDAIVANAGAVKVTHDWDIEDMDWEWYFTANFKIAYRFTQKFIPDLTKTAGSIVLINSIAGLEHIGAPLPYSTAKAALAMYSKGLSYTLASKNIRVNTVSPGNIFFEGGNWDLKLKVDSTKVQNLIHNHVPLKCFGSVEDIGNAVAFLLSRKASFITGSNLVIDGGQSQSI